MSQRNPADADPANRAARGRLLRGAAVKRQASDVDLVLVDDDEIVHLFVKRQLRRTSLTLKAFIDPERALAWLQVHRPRLLLIDHRMPRLDGPALLDALGGSEIAADRVILCSAGRNDPAVHRLASEVALTVMDKADLLDRRQFLDAVGLQPDPGRDQCAGTTSEPDSKRVSSALPSTRAAGR